MRDLVRVCAGALLEWVWRWGGGDEAGDGEDGSKGELHFDELEA